MHQKVYGVSRAYKAETALKKVRPTKKQLAAEVDALREQLAKKAALIEGMKDFLQARL